ncbi:DUF1345 domain-containing protein [Agrococcus jejuensis]|uniref:Uncharacterized membrane protein n=1 Tax=Agrococcus jejuensis TaxID=399736 RepID=A0A1G8E5L2_9MICO|nr:DUF1345 domain-containing protein [Agrococcus jejuensis]SDH65222.1 Uncharacterized membrane protein [Agrococcus jejuensis]
MSRGTSIMHREVVRSSVATVIAFAVMGALFVVAGRFGLLVTEASSISAVVLALTFGLYGPIFLALTWLSFRDLRGAMLRSHVVRSDERSRVVRLLMLAGPKSWAMLVIVAGVYSVVLLTTGEARSNPWLVSVCVLGVAGTWVLMVAVFAIEYMRSWANHESLVFPGDEERTFRDFLYLSVQQSTTFSSSDVQIVRGHARSLAMVHSVVAFAYSTAIIAVFASLLIAVAG